MSTELYRLIGKRIRHLRKSMDLNQSELAERVGLSVQSISGYEKGDTGVQLKHLYKFREVFGVSFDQLLPRNDQSLFEIDSEAVLDLWSGLEDRLKAYAPSGAAAARSFLEFEHSRFLDEVANDFHNVFESVSISATGASDNVIVFRIRESFQRSFTQTAKERLGFRCH